MLEAIGKTGFSAGSDVYLALDVASSELWEERNVRVQEIGGADAYTGPDGGVYADWVRQYPIISIEDGVAEGDWPGWQR